MAIHGVFALSHAGSRGYVFSRPISPTAAACSPSGSPRCTWSHLVAPGCTWLHLVAKLRLGNPHPRSSASPAATLRSRDRAAEGHGFFRRFRPFSVSCEKQPRFSRVVRLTVFPLAETKKGPPPGRVPGGGPLLIPGRVAQALPVPVTSLSSIILASRGAEVNPKNETLHAKLGVPGVRLWPPQWTCTIHGASLVDGQKANATTGLAPVEQ